MALDSLTNYVAAHPQGIAVVLIALVLVIIVLYVYFHGIFSIGPYDHSSKHGKKSKSNFDSGHGDNDVDELVSKITKGAM